MRRFLLLALLVAIPPHAYAIDVPVEYTVDEKVLKKNAFATQTTLTFDLHEASDCLDSPVHSETVAVEDVALLERLKLLKVKGGPKVPKTVRIRQTLTGAPDAVTYFARVTGSNPLPLGDPILAVGGECQLQFTTVSSSPIIETRVDAIETVLAPVSLEDAGMTLRFSGVNVQVVDGSGDTGGAVNGKGNILVGYNEAAGGEDRTGSHNIVLGTLHEFKSYGGFVGGTANALSAQSGFIATGTLNDVVGPHSMVGAGVANVGGEPGDGFAAVLGGLRNEARGPESAICGGRDNVVSVSTEEAVVCGGDGNTATGDQSAICGGTNNSAIGQASVVAGGSGGSVTAAGSGGVLAGGLNNTVSGHEAFAAGGSGNDADQSRCTITGGSGLTCVGPGTHHPSGS